MLVGEFLKAAVALAVVLDKHHVPDLAPPKKNRWAGSDGVERDSLLGSTTIAPTASTRTRTGAVLHWERPSLVR